MSAFQKQRLSIVWLKMDFFKMFWNLFQEHYEQRVFPCSLVPFSL